MEDNNTTIHEYAELYKKLNILNKEVKEIKTKIKEKEPSVFDFMSNLNVDSVCYKDVTINRVNRKISKKFKKEIITQKVIDNIGDTDISNKLVESLLTDESCETEPALKTKVKS